VGQFVSISEDILEIGYSAHPTLNYKKGCTRLAAKSDKVYQLLAYGQCFSSGTPASSTTKTGRHDIAESGIKHNKSNQINQAWFY
jgi:hypothetical protein